MNKAVTTLKHVLGYYGTNAVDATIQDRKVLKLNSSFTQPISKQVYLFEVFITGFSQK